MSNLNFPTWFFKNQVQIMINRGLGKLYNIFGRILLLFIHKQLKQVTWVYSFLFYLLINSVIKRCEPRANRGMSVYLLYTYLLYISQRVSKNKVKSQSYFFSSKYSCPKIVHHSNVSSSLHLNDLTRSAHTIVLTVLTGV